MRSVLRLIPLSLPLTPLLAQQAVPPAAVVVAPAAFEVPPVFDATRVLAPQWLQGPHHRVRPVAPSDGFLTHFTIDSDFGVFECVGRRELELRVREIGAIAELVQVSKSDLFAEGLKRSVEAPIDAVKNIVQDPVESAKQVPSTVGHFFKKVGSSIGNTAKKVGRQIDGAQGGEVDAGEAWSATGRGLGNAAKSVAGFDKAKLDTARQLGVDPYSDNPRLQDEMEKVTWAFFAGGMPLRVAGAVTGAGLAVTAAKGVGLPEDIYDVTPGELALRDRNAMEAMGADAALIDAVFANPVLSISARHGIVGKLASFTGAGRVEVIRVAAGLDQSRQAAFLDEALAILVARAATTSYEEIRTIGRLPAARSADGVWEVAAPVDFVSWTEPVAGFVARDELAGDRRLVLHGELSDAARAGLAAAGWQVIEPAH